ncbi:MAG: glycosyltransferase family 2 protein [Micrococcales bacterium]|nr:glycosyltransferase family 2 protein [Micrococcales bacterium]
MTASPRVTIGVPVYNGERYLAEALTSLVEQDFQDMEILVSDNASDDATVRIAEEFAARDPRVVVVRQEKNIGGAHNSNVLMDAARGEYFKWAYHDDRCAPGMVSALVAQLDADPDAVAACPTVMKIDEDGTDLGRWDERLYVDLVGPAHERLAQVLRHRIWPVQFGMFRTSAVRAAGGVYVSTAGEYVLPAAIAVRGNVRLVPEAVQQIRHHVDRSGGERRSEAVWVDPNRPHVAFPYSRKIPLVRRAVLDAGLDRAERRRCLRVVFRDWTLPGVQTVVGDLIRLPLDLGWVRPRR